MSIGAKVTLRGDRMWEFLDRLALDRRCRRIRDFRGLNPNAFDGHGELHARRDRAADLPGDRLRQGREGPGHGHHDRDHGEERRRGPRAAARARVPVRGEPAVAAAVELRRRDDMAKKALMEQAAGAGRSSACARTRAARGAGGRAPLPQVPAVPDLLPRARARGRAAGGDEGVMVRARDTMVMTDPIARHADPDPQRQPRLQGRAGRARLEDERGASLKILAAEGYVERLRRGGRGHASGRIRVTLKYGAEPRAHDHRHQAHLQARPAGVRGPRRAAAGAGRARASRSCRPPRAS